MATEQLLTPPAVEPVSVSDVRAHARIDVSDDDAYLQNIVIPAARQAVENATERALISQGWRFLWPAFPALSANADPCYVSASQPASDPTLRIPRGRCLAVTAMKYVDSDGVTQTLVAGTDYQVALASDFGARISPVPAGTWPVAQINRLDAVIVEATLGYGAAASDVPPALRHAVLLMCAHLYENREAVQAGVAMSELPLGVDALCAPYRIHGFA